MNNLYESFCVYFDPSEVSVVKRHREILNIDGETTRPRSSACDVVDLLSFFIFYVENHSTSIFENFNNQSSPCEENSMKTSRNVIDLISVKK